ncbi:twin-arginine translocase TatA/TatE family subunit [Microbacterium sp. zg.B48]|uniref:twin-arginine translocase TatA/TatE family subunit n=1 Tax=unclassified Microbacterium TaxID=2609290 RepID=UPI00214B5934|nr:MULTISPECIES: twin-arginine translocase TatA/TatE family subunit [unclassified Microbacterium]MCR2762092.1 twin-arginine translocase TatA/TatE family subunit [Microbacterium sp. zg.B48]MCR2809901.1 twin-arginine translocase TatA/TatE family subunit [Microbacterium sp. zg.B185]WIM17792.1 twin-arginine translocase TatA/TatE family subunit [Microbacterium sp. zg-B185]
MLQGLTGWHFLIILAVILLLFGAAKLPALAKSMGQSARVFKGEMKAMKDDDPAVGKTESLASPASEGSVTQTTADASRAADNKP